MLLLAIGPGTTGNFQELRLGHGSERLPAGHRVQLKEAVTARLQALAVQPVKHHPNPFQNDSLMPCAHNMDLQVHIQFKAMAVRRYVLRIEKIILIELGKLITCLHCPSIYKQLH